MAGNVGWAILQFLVPFGFMFGFVVAAMLPLMIWMERKVSAYIQDRRGPNRAQIFGVRLFGMVHNVADVIKLITKEDTEPNAADKTLFRLAPFLVMTLALMTMAVVPFGEPLQIGTRQLHFQIAPLNAGILYIFAVSSLSVYGVILAGWSSGNQFSFLGALRASSQMVSYEVGMSLSVIGILLAYSTTDMVGLVQTQGHNPLTWGFFISPIGFLIFLVCLFAETNRNPFDLPEGESELVAGFHVEYSSLKFALFFMGEYVSIIVGSAVIATLFFGGWHVPFLSNQFIHKHSLSLLTGMMLVGGIGLLGIAVLLIANILKPMRIWGDQRDNEPRVFLPLVVVAAFVMFAVALVGLPMFQGMAPVWLQHGTRFLLQITSFCAKTFLFSFFFIWVRWTLPRFRYDQVMRLGWQIFVPLGIANIFVTYIWARIWLRLWGVYS